MLSSVKNVVTLPESAIEFAGEEAFVYIVKEGNEGKNYVRTKVTTGLSDGVSIEIKSGVKTTDKVRGPQIINNVK